MGVRVLQIPTQRRLQPPRAQTVRLCVQEIRILGALPFHHEVEALPKAKEPSICLNP